MSINEDERTKNCLKYGDLIQLHYNSKQSMIDTHLHKKNQKFEDQKEQQGFLSATG